MAFSLFAALSLSVIYRLTINLPDLPYSHELRRVGSDEFLKTSKELSEAIDKLLVELPGEHRASVFQFRYHQIIGTLAYVDVYTDSESPRVRDVLLAAAHDGQIGDFAVSNEGFEVHVIKDDNANCAPTEFRCLDGSCIAADRRCDGRRDCADGSDESRKHAECKRHVPLILQTEKEVSTPKHGTVHLSAIIDHVPAGRQVIWSRNGKVIGEGTLATGNDDRLSVYHTSDQYFLRIENATDGDAGEFKIMVEGMNVEASFTVNVTPDKLAGESEGCPEGERACKSGHCLPVSQFCDRTVQCPDGDDEVSCTRVECTSSELLCEANNVCVPMTVACDGWRDCHDGSDEKNCTEAHKAHKKVHHGKHQRKPHSRLTVACEDGSTPEYSLHGSTYCWSNSVCPSSTACVQGLCCAVGPNSTIRQCPSHLWECLDGTCLEWKSRCDGTPQCADSGDERHCGNEKRSVAAENCGAEEFHCKSGECIAADKKCNRHYDCADGSDETTCDYYLAVQKYHEQNQNNESNDINSAQPVAQAAQAPELERHGVHHASHSQSSQHSTEASAQPEKQCTDQEFRCPYLEVVKCFHYDKLCDGHDDCGDGSDETNCDSTEDDVDGAFPAPSASSSVSSGQCTPQQFRCHSGRCIDLSLHCNRKYDCDDGTDETECEYFKAASQPRTDEREEELKRREQELERREQEERRREEEERRREHDERRREEEEKQRNGEGARRQQEEQRRNGDDARRQQEEQRREEEEKRRNGDDARRQHEERLRQSEEARRRHEDEVRRREEERRRHEQQQPQPQQRHPAQPAPQPQPQQHAQQHSQQHVQQQQQTQEQQRVSAEIVFRDEYDEESTGCLEHEFQCAIGECIDRRRVCDTRPDCLDSSDELNCSEKVAPAHPPTLPPVPTHNHIDQDIDSEGSSDVQITIYPTEAQVREGRDVSFDCRARTADNSVYPPTRWTRVGGPLPSSAHDSGGRLTFNPVSLSDAGTYVCVATHDGRTVEATATLNVLSYGPQELQGHLQSSGQCMADEKACGNNECVKSDYVCDGEPDCRDRSDEQNCPALRQCEPNEFKCNNQRCVQKMWLCDGDDDCGDNSDEMNCGAKTSGDVCKATEFKCHDGRQCVPTSFHCDGTNDCHDGSDEVGCVQPTVVEPPETNKQVPQGSSFTLTCKAVAVPEPYINWRLNWGPVCEPPRCLQTSEGGYGTLTVNNAQPIDQGAYTCEAINVKGRVLATPDCIVRIVDIPAPPPPTRAPEPQRQPTCNTVGSVSPYPNYYGSCDCKPLVTGPNCDQCKPGSFHLSEKSPQGCLKCFCFGITDQCRSSNYYRTKDRLMFAGDAEGVTLSDMEERQIDRDTQFQFFKTGYLTFDGTTDGVTKYWRLPQRFLGDKVTAYGGKMEFEIEFSGSGPLSNEPMVVLKGNQNILVHRVRSQQTVLTSDNPVRITVDTYETNFEQLNGAPATREDLLMVLADLDAFMIRATHVSQQSSTSLGDVSWEIAVDRNTPDGLALEVEQCSCPPGYVGTSCEDCAPGYERSGHGPYLGTCVPVQQRAQCGAGAVAPSSSGRCQCKTSVTGPNCDQCAPHSFGLSPKNPQGCIPCFCSGVTQQCSASNYKRTTVQTNYGQGDRDQLTLTTSDSRQPFTPSSQAYVSGREIEFRGLQEANGQTLYWKLPEKFLGNKVTAYGGTLKYTFRFSGNGRSNQDPHIILRGNDITLQYTHRETVHPDRENTIELSIFEDKWQRVDGQQATREHLLMALADLDTLLIKATYVDDGSQSSLISASLEYAEPYGGGLTAAEVEQCICPAGYIGTSCEDCAPGYSRTGGGLYLGLCERCECHGHASQCDKEYGYCLECQHNTEGDQCERCKPGFVGDARRGTPQDCQPAATRPPCQCNNHSPRGCDSFGRCLLCEHNTEGTHCERCKKGYYGDASKGTPYDCTPCPCPGASDCYLDSQGQVSCRNCPAGLDGRLCNECAPGYTRSNKQAGRVCEPIGSITSNDRTYVPPPPEGGRPPQPVVDPPHLTVNEGEPAAFRCWVPGIPDCQITWHKEHLGGALPHGVYQTGNALKIPQAQMHDAGNYICSAANQYGIGQSTPARLDVVRPAQKPKVDPMEQTVNEGEPARFRCWVPNNPNAQLRWSRPGNAPLPAGVQEQQGILHVPRTTDRETGEYICTATDPRDNSPQQSDPVRLNLQRPEPIRSAPQVDPPEQTVNEGDPAQFRCWVPGNPQAKLQWARQDGRAFPQGTLERDGFLRIEKSRLDDAGQYICTASDPRGGAPQQAPPAVLNVRKPQAIRPEVDPPEQTVNEGEPARIRCWVPGNPNVQLRWSKSGRRPLPQEAHEQSGHLTIPRTQKADEGDYVCTATDPNTNRPIDSSPARVNVRQPLRPMVDPAEQTIPEGTPFRIRCWVPGHPDAQLTWRKASGGSLSADSDQDDGIYSVGRAEFSDEGDYVCSVRDPASGQPIDSTPATVHVTSGPQQPVESQGVDDTPQISPPSQTVPEGDPAKITCTVPGKPNARLTFRRADNRPLPFGSSDHGGVLSIPATTLTDAGQYICVYYPENGQPPKQTTPSVLHVESPGTPPRPVATPPVLTVSPNEPARFHCDAHSRTPATIKWTFGDSHTPLPNGAEQEGDDVVIDAADDAHVGDYVCTATNEFGTGEAEPVKLRITDDEQPPTARVEPRVWNGKPGDRHQFRCIVTGSPAPKITWTGPDGSPLPHDVTALEPNILDFSNGRSELNGDYTCTATNPVGEASDHGSVNIGPALTVKTTPAGPRLILTVGEPLQVKCEAIGAPGDPEPEVEWLHDPGPERGDLPDDFKPVTISEQFIRHPSIGLGNAGAYTCKGSNTHATATKNIYIEVVEPSRIATVSVLGGSSQWFEQGEPGELICTATGSSLVDRLEWVKVDDQLPGDVEEHNEPGLLHFANFKNSYAGDYECRGYRNNELIASSTVHVHSASDSDDEPRVEIEPPRVRVVSQGESIVLKCSVDGAKNGEHFKWALLRGGSLVRQLGKEPELTINNANPNNDFGVYRCNVEDDNGIVIGSAYTAVSIGFKPANNTDAQIVKFDDKSDASFTCPIYTVPGSKVEWRRESGDLPPNAVPSGNKLEIKNFDDSSTGLYICKVTFEDNVVEGYVQAQIFVPDTIIQVLLDVSSESPEIGQRAWFDCKVTGDPSAVITWSKEGSDELPPNSQVTGGRLLFTDVTEDNAGVYRCIAKTKAGPLQTRTVLNVGSSKRKRKHTNTRRGRRLRHRRRHANASSQRRSVAVAEPKHHSAFGAWFSTI